MTMVTELLRESSIRTHFQPMFIRHGNNTALFGMEALARGQSHLSERVAAGELVSGDAHRSNEARIFQHRYLRDSRE